MSARRHLTVLQASPPSDENDVARPDWQWVGFGVLLTFAFWGVLASLVVAVVRLFPPGEVVADPELGRIDGWGGVQALLHLLGCALAFGSAGFVIGRFAPRDRARLIAGIVSLVTLVLASSIAYWLGNYAEAVHVAVLFTPLAAGTQWAAWRGRRARGGGSP